MDANQFGSQCDATGNRQAAVANEQSVQHGANAPSSALSPEHFRRVRLDFP